jgi:CRP-like cAMP-binding protein
MMSSALGQLLENEAGLPPTPKPALAKTRHISTLRHEHAVVETTPNHREIGRNCDSLESLFQGKSFEQHFQPDSTILLHDEPADAVYFVKSGTVRCCTISANGKRQIFSFVGKGGFVGISDFDRWHFTAEAVDHVILQSIPKATLEQMLAINISLRQDVRGRVRALLECREQQLLSLVSAKAPERLLNFLTEFAATRSSTGYIVLPMCRRDIADHLGLSVETVSRAFSDLKLKGRIDLATHEKYKIL